MNLFFFIHFSFLFLFWHSTNFVNGFHHKLTKRELIKTFGIEHHKNVPEYELIQTVREIGSDGRLQKMKFTAWNSTFEIYLKPNNKLISPNIISVIRDENGTVQKFQGLPEHIRTDCHYHGEVLSHGNLKAAVSNCRELMGVIVTDNHFLMIQTIPERIRHLQDEDHLIYKREAALLNPLEHFSFNEEPIRVEMNEDDATEFCDVSKSIDEIPASFASDLSASINSVNYTIPSEAKLDSLFIFPQNDPITLEIGLFLDSKLYDHFQREFTRSPDQHLTDFALALINNVHVLYQQPTLSPNLDVVIVRFEMWKQQPPPLETTLHKNGQAQTLLDSFCRYQAKINPGTDLSDPGHWDHGVLLTGYDIYHTTSSVAGVAPVARMCDELFACSLVEGLHLGRSFVLAHEMGHNMGMVHDGVQNQCGRGCCLMSAVNGAGKTTWSTCSVREFNAFLLQLDETGNGNCLRDPAMGIDSYNHLTDGRLPGQRFTADQQCSYFWGQDYQVEIPNGRNMDDICRILWCGNSGSTISTAHPALEGSFCGTQKWCQEGICQPWKQSMFQPQIIHGGWSDWTNSHKECPINNCQISGGIAIKPQLRTCTEPAPNNGGRGCSGSNIRGLICGQIDSTCHGLSRQEFGDRLCNAIKNDPSRPDRQLSGKSFLHLTQPCKIWCHVENSELIRNKGQFPNGSPCGLNKYCVSGACLSLSCNEKALVTQDKDCPSIKSKQSTDKWESWTNWSTCSVSCSKSEETPIQKRTRTCSSLSCDGKTIETRPCSPFPPLCELYKEWTEWSVCSRSCDGGKMTRRRDCNSGNNCKEKLIDIKNCGEESCATWYEWQNWSSCSANCGPGQKSRIRSCSKDGVCEGETRQIAGCIGDKCQQESWGEWGPCSVSCGIGFQLRERLCDGILCAESSKQARTCNVQDCPKNSLSQNGHLWSQWSNYGSCSATCGEGVQKRSRICLTGNCPVIDPTNQEKRCVLGPCPIWGSWGDFNMGCPSCSVLELRSRERVCKISYLPEGDGQTVPFEQCGGSKIEVKNCEEICKITELQINSKTNFDTSSLASLTLNMPSNDSEYSEWQEWMSCSVTCGGGLRERIRFCPENKDCSKHGLSFELEECNKESCESVKASQMTPWSEWSQCTVKCGGGRQFRSRKCKALFVFLCDGSLKEEKQCNTASCGVPLTKAAGVPTLILSESSDLAPIWSTWSNWSKCSCFTLTQFRRRFCMIQDPSVQGFCAGGIVDQRHCEPTDCLPEHGSWSQWSGWSKCSKDCGIPGHQIRNRMCSDPLPSNRGSYCIGYSFDQRPCEPLLKICTAAPIDGEWSEWTTFSECSNPCENGQRSRTRFCSNPRPQNGGKQCFGSDFELKPCGDLSQCRKLNGEWSIWGSWSTCSSSCGIAFKSRFRTCSNPRPENGTPCPGLARQTIICNTEFCPNSVDGIWSSWSSWGQCHSNCKGVGTRTRNRVCSTPRNGGMPCFGKSSESQLCQSEQLDNPFCDAILRHEQALESIFMTRSIR